MADALSQIKFIKAVGLSVNEDGLQFTHDYGEKDIPWDTISHVFGVMFEKQTRFPSLLFILITADSQTFYYVDGSTYTPRYFSSDSEMTSPDYEHQSIPYSQIRKSKDDEFKKFMKEISSRCESAVIDDAFLGYMRGNKMFLPTFSSLKDIASYCVRKRDSASKREKDSIVDLDAPEDEEMKIISMLTKKREELKEGTLLDGRYVVEEVFRGGMGIVYIVFDPQNIRFYAVKTFQEKYLWDEKAVRQFIKEAEIWIDLESHPNIVKAELVKIIEGKPYIFLEYVTGIDLERLLRRYLIPVKTAIKYAIQFCTGMNYAFRKLNLIHRDIKPSNCLITKDGVLKITDFGLGKIFDEAPQEGELIVIPMQEGKKKKTRTVSSSTMMMGTIPFMAPELFSSIKSAGVKTDIYSFGVLLYVLLTGKNPFFDDDIVQVIENHKKLITESPRNLNSEVPEALASLTLKCLEKDPKRRFADFCEIEEKLRVMYKETTGEEYRQPEREEVFTEEEWLNKGLSLASLGRHGEAIITFNQALLQNPQSLRAMIYKGYSLLNFGKVLEALLCLDEGMKIDSHNWELWFYKGESHRKLGQKFVALSCFDRALTLTSGQSRILGQKGRLYYEMGKVQEAIDCYNTALSQDPRAAEIWYEKGRLLAEQNDYDDAVECLDQSLDINPRFKWGWYHQGLAFGGLGYFNEAIGAHKRAILLDGDFIEAWTSMGDCYKSLGKNEEAIKAYQQAIELRPDYLQAYVSTVLLLKQESRWEEALETANTALGIDPRNVRLQTERAEILIHLGCYEEAITLCESLVEKDPQNEVTSQLLQTAKKWLSEKKRFFGIIFSHVSPGDTLTRDDLNSLLCTYCDISDAINYLESNRVADEQTSYLKATLYFIVGEYNRALQLVKSSLDGLPGNQKALRLKELIEERLGSGLRKRIQIFKKSESAERSAEVLLILAIEKIRKKSYSEARDMLRDALSADPSMHACRFFLARAYELDAKIDKADYYYTSFMDCVPLSIGFCKKRLSACHQSSPREIESVFHRLIANYQNNHQYWLSYIMYLLENGHYRKMQLLALGMLEKYLQECELSREESLYWNIRGLLQLYLGRYGDSRGSFSKAASFDGENGTTSLGLAQCLLGKRLFEEAERACRTLQQSHDTTKMASFLLSDLYLTKGFLTRPLSVLEEALQRSPDSPLLLMRKAYVLFVLKKTREFAGFHHEIYPLCSKSFYMKLLRSLSLVDSQKIDDAVFELSSLMASNRHHIIVLKSLGFLSLQSQDLIKAMSIFDSILEFYPVDFELYLGKGMVYYLMKDYRSAFECFQRALELNPLDSGLWQCLGALYYHLEKYDESERCWDRGLRYCRSMAQPLTNRGIYLSRRGRHLEALECIEKALRLEPENHRLLLIKANCQAHLSSPEDAVGTVEKVLTLQPQSLQGWILRATLEFSQKNYEVSFQSYDKAVQLDNRNALLWYNRALVAMFMNNRLEARRSLERTLVINPDFFEALLAQYILDGLMGFNRELELTGARLKAVNPERFQAWQRRFRETEDPLHALKPLEVSECDFELPVLMPLYHIRQVEVFDFLFNQNME